MKHVVSRGKPFFRGFLFLIIICNALFLKANHAEEYLGDEISSFSTFDPNDFWDSPTIDDTYADHLNSRKISPFDLLQILTNDPINLQIVLQNDFYKYTNPVNVRPLLDLPIHERTFYLLSDDGPCYRGGISMVPFYNESRKQYYTKNSWQLSSYLAFCDSAILNAIKKISELVPNGDDIDFAQIMSLFSGIKFEERRLGLMSGITLQACPFIVTFQTPLYYLEHNFYLNDDEQSAITHDPFFQNLPSIGDTAQSTDAFLKEHLVNDMIGFGDTRVTALINLKETEKLHCWTGAECTIPTAISFNKRYIGTHPQKCPTQPYLNINELLTKWTEGSDEVYDILLSLGTHVLDRLSRVVGDTKLGSERVGLGIICAADWEPHPCVHIYQELHPQVLLPYTTTRMFREIKNPWQFDRKYNDESQADTNLAFLANQLINTLYPIAHDTHIATQSSVEYTAEFEYTSRCIEFGLFYNYWYRSAEQLQLKDPIFNGFQLDLLAATTFSCSQHKVGGRCIWHPSACERKSSWHVGIVGDAALAYTGIGGDWSIGLFIGATW